MKNTSVALFALIAAAALTAPTQSRGMPVLGEQDHKQDYAAAW